MYKNVLASIPGIEYYPIVALALFFSFFIGLTIWYFRADRQLLNVQANQPFDEGCTDHRSSNNAYNDTELTMADKDKLLDHEADGIQEYDNNLPRWWLYGFYFTIIMSAIYMFYYHVYGGSDWNILWYGPKTPELEYAAEVEEAKAMMASAPKGPEVKIALLTDATSLAKGKEIFNSTNSLCMTCHREDLGGQVGPNLTDDYWIHGCSIEEIVANIKSGFPEKGMLPYGSTNKLSDQELLRVASYIISMKGSNPPDPKPIEEGRDVVCPPAETAPPAQ